MSHRAYEVLEDYIRTQGAMGRLIAEINRVEPISIEKLPKITSLSELYERR